MKVIASTIAVAVTLVSMPVALADDLSWKRGVAGARAFLDEDGSGGSDKAVLCNTLKEYIEWREQLPPPGAKWDKAPVTGCHEFPRGLPARLDGILPDPTRVSGDLNLPIAHVTIESRRYTGFMGLLGLKPVIPPGTVVHYDGKDLGRASLAPSPNSGVGDGLAMDGAVTVRVLRYQPTAELYVIYVQVLTGQMVGKRGWMSTSGGETSDGNPVDWFNEMAVAANER